MFGKLRETFFPIYGREWIKFLPLLFMLSLICFNYSLLRNLKDSLVITARDSGAEVIPFIKVWGILPAAVGMAYLYTWLSNRLTQAQVFVGMTLGFLLYFSLFALVIYPFRDQLHPHAFADALEEFLPKGLHGFVAMIRNWTFTSFYIIAELWATYLLTVMFWGFANQISTVNEASRFYGIIHMGSNIATALSGQVGVWSSQTSYNPHFPLGNTAWEQTLLILTALIVMNGLLTLGLYWWMQKYVVSDPQLCPPNTQKTPKKKQKTSLRESISHLMQSRYLLCIATLVVSYNLVINLIEVVWKGKVKLLYPDPLQCNIFMNQMTSAVGLVSAMGALVLPLIIRRLGWTTAAMITPLILLITGAGFFGFLWLPEGAELGILNLLGPTTLAIAVYCGAIQNVLSKAAKYSVFDVTKEISFIPLDPEEKTKCKAAIDGIGSRLGKSGGSLIQQGLLVAFGSLAAITGPVAVIILVLIAGWIWATKTLGTLFAQRTKHAKQKKANKKKSEESPSLALNAG